jgi:hypothetical protein
MADLRIEYEPLKTLRRWPRNPKDHDLGTLHLSIDRFGFVTPLVVDEATGYLAEGHGRLDALEQKRRQGDPPPLNIHVENGDWLVPVVRGNRFGNDDELAAFVVAANQLTIGGWWDEAALAEVLSSLAAGQGDILKGTGFDTDALNNLLSKLNPLPMDDIAHSTDQSVPGGDGFDIITTVPTTDDRDTLTEWLTARGYRYEVRLTRKALK